MTEVVQASRVTEPMAPVPLLHDAQLRGFSHMAIGSMAKVGVCTFQRPERERLSLPLTLS